MFNYGMWNVIPMQMTMMITVLAMICYARAAWGRDARAAAGIFSLAALAVIVGQAAGLARGSTLPNLWDASEYKELFIALGLLVGAADLAFRPGRHRGPPGPVIGVRAPRAREG